MAIIDDAAGFPICATDGKSILDLGVPTGSVPDLVRRLRGLLPRGWFPDATWNNQAEQAPVLVAILTGFATCLAGIWQLLGEVAGQLRVAGMSGGFLDMAAADLFGPSGVVRGSGESDDVYRRRILASVVVARNTRAAMSNALQALTGVAPTIVEPQNATDCGGYGARVSAVSGGAVGYGGPGLRYGHRGAAQFFVETPVGLAGSAAAVQAMVARTKACGVVGWVRIVD